MNILIIGASRGIGLQLLKQSLSAGHNVTALARHFQELPDKMERPRAISGDILDEPKVREVMAGQEAVCLTIGVGVTIKAVTVFSRGTQNVLAAMAEHGVRRLLCITGIGAGDSKGHGGFLYDRIFQPLLLKTIYEDKDRQEAMIRASDTDWTIVRPGFLSNGPLTGHYRVITDIRDITAGRISRADVAHFMLGELSANRYLGQAPLLMY